MISKYYDSVKEYTGMSKDVGFDAMETILARMEDDGMSFTEAYDTFNALVEYVLICEGK
jgi:hypothetical protein